VTGIHWTESNQVSLRPVASARGFLIRSTARMPVRFRRLLPALGLALVAAGCHSDGGRFTGPFDPPLGASLEVGDLVRLNVNGEQNCTNGIYHIARVEAIGDKSMILADTLNPKNGFTTADYQRYAAKFDTLIYPLDEGAFGAPTDIDNNGRVGIIFTRAVNELTPAGSDQYVGGFTFSRDLFPKVGTDRAEACETSNQGEYFYALAPDPLGTINSNPRSTDFVDKATVPVLAHELQHLINVSRLLYVNTTATAYEEVWLDEGLAHIAEELLFYRESRTAPRTNLDLDAIRARSAIVTAFNEDMIGNAGRYGSYLEAPNTSSPYASGDELTTRGAAWDFLRYLADQKVLAISRSASADIELNGTGTVSVPGGTAGAEYYATLVNAATDKDVTTAYGIVASGVTAPSLSRSPVGGAALSLSAMTGGMSIPTLRRDRQFEARLRASERTMGPARVARARQWYGSEISHLEVPQGGRYSVSAVPIASPDADLWFRLANNSLVGVANLQNVFGVNVGTAVADWSASHAVDDVSTLPADQFQQKSWNWRTIYPALTCQGCAPAPYPLTVRTMVSGTGYSDTILSGGSTHFRFAVPPGTSANLTVTSTTPGTSAALRLIVVRTK
jgi:hypothetical protein